MVKNKEILKNKLDLKSFLIDVLLKTKNTSLDLFKIMVPIVLAIKILQEINLLEYIVHPFNYIMQLVGLPEIYSLVWLGAIFNTCYMAMTLVAVFFQEYPLTVEQITVLGFMVLVSHSLFIEGAIVHKFKVNGFFNTFLRVITSLVFGYLIHITAQHFGLMQERATSPFYTETVFYSKTFLELYKTGMLHSEFNIWFDNILIWLYSQGKTLCLIVFVIFTIFLVIELLKRFNIVSKIDALFKPFFSIMRISKSNYTVTSICYLIGLSYGYGLLKEERDKSPYFKKDQPFKSLSFLAIAHAIIEDGIIFILLGANGWIVILGRSLVGVLVVMILSWLVLPRLSEKTKNKWLYKNISTQN